MAYRLLLEDTGIISSYPSSNLDGYYLVNASFGAVSQSFIGGERISSARLWLQKAGNFPNSLAYAAIFATTGTNGSTAKPTGSPLAVSQNIKLSDLTDEGGFVEFDFTGSNFITLTAGQTYAIAVVLNAGDASAAFNVGYDTSSPAHAGNSAYEDTAGAGWIADATKDLIFELAYENIIDGFLLEDGSGYLVQEVPPSEAVIHDVVGSQNSDVAPLYQTSVVTTKEWPVGSSIIAVVGFRPQADADPNHYTVLDGSGLPYTQDVFSMTANINGLAVLARHNIQTAIPAGTTLTVKAGDTGNKVSAYVMCVTGLDYTSGSPLDKMSVNPLNNVASPSGTVYTSNATTTTATASQFQLGALMLHIDAGAATVQSGWTAPVAGIGTTGGSAGANAWTWFQYRNVSSIGTYASEPTGVARNFKSSISTYRVAPSPEVTPRLIEGRARIVSGNAGTTTNQTQSGAARIQKAASADISGNARIQKSGTASTSGTSRITASVPVNQNGRANIVGAITATTQTQIGKAAISRTVEQLTSGASRIQKTFAPTQSGVSRVERSASSDQPGRSRITASIPRDQQGTARIQKSFSSDISGSATIKLANPKASTLVDNFDDNSINTSKWEVIDLTGVAETNQRIEFTTGTEPAYPNLTSLAAYDLTGSQFYAELVNAGNQSFTSHEAILQARIGANDRIYISINNGNKEVKRQLAGSYSALHAVPYDPVNHRWMRIRESGGFLYFDTSTDGETWSNFYSYASDWPVDAVNLSVQGGHYLVEASGTTVVWDNFNTPKTVDTTKTTTQEGIARISRSATSDQLGTSRIQRSASSDQPGRARIQITAPLQNQQGTARVTASKTSDQSGRARLAKNVDNNQSGKSRVEITSTAVQSGKASIPALSTQQQLGKAAILRTVTFTLEGKARIERSGTASQDGKSRVSVTASHNQSGKASIPALSTQTQSGVSRIEKSASASTDGKARVQRTTTASQDGKTRISRTETAFTSGTARVTTTNAPSVSGVARIETTRSGSQDGRSRIQVSVDRDISGQSRITNIRSSDQSGRSRLSVIQDKDLPGQSRIQRTESSSRDGKANIVNTYSSFQSGVSRLERTSTAFIVGKAAVLRTFTSDISGKSRIQSSATAIQDGKSRLARITDFLQDGKARIERSSTAFIVGKAAVLRSFTVSQEGLARITALLTSIQEGKARIERSATATQEGKSRVQRSASTDQTGKARLSRVEDETIDGKARVTATSSAPQDGKASVQRTTDRTQDGKARIEVTAPLVTQLGKAAILRSVEVTTAGKSRIERSATSTQDGKGRIERTAPLQTQDGKARVQRSATATQDGKARVERTEPQIASGKAAILRTTDRTQDGTARLQRSPAYSQDGKGNISATVPVLQSGKASIRTAVNRDQNGLARIIPSKSVSGLKDDFAFQDNTKWTFNPYVTVSNGAAVFTGNTNTPNISTALKYDINDSTVGIHLRTKTGLADTTAQLLLLMETEYQPGNYSSAYCYIQTNKFYAIIYVNDTKIDVANGVAINVANVNFMRMRAVGATVHFELSGDGISWTSYGSGTVKNATDYRLVIQYYHPTDGNTFQLESVNYFTSVMTREQTGRAFLNQQATVTTSGRSRLGRNTEVSQSGKGAVLRSVQHNQSGKASIPQSALRLQLGKAAIANLATQTQSGTGNIRGLRTQTQIGRAAVAGLWLRETTGKSRITATAQAKQSGAAFIVRPVVSPVDQEVGVYPSPLDPDTDILTPIDLPNAEFYERGARETGNWTSPPDDVIGSWDEG